MMSLLTNGLISSIATKYGNSLCRTSNELIFLVLLRMKSGDISELSGHGQLQDICANNKHGSRLHTIIIIKCYVLYCAPESSSIQVPENHYPDFLVKNILMNKSKQSSTANII